jgi:ABC-type transport system involved in cytochrome c biogenesis permease subunit
MLLITGAIWANESWGRPWGFDSKETGALIAWLTYAAFLHTRISKGWRGRSSAYFAILGFLLVILHIWASVICCRDYTAMHKNSRYDSE